MYDRAAILRRAWELNNAHFVARPWLVKTVNRSDFAFHLTNAWREAKAAQLTAPQRRAEAIRAELARLEYSDAFLMTHRARRASLNAELSAIAA